MEHPQAWHREAASGQRDGAFYVRQFGAALFVRLLVWICFGGLAIVSLLLAVRHGSGALRNAAILTGVLYLFERRWGRHAPLGKPLLTVDASGIGSTAFPHNRPHLRWHEIADVSVRDIRGGPVLVVEPKPIPGKASRACRVRLAMLRKADRQLVQGLISHHMPAAGIAWTQTMEAEQAFAAQMKALPHTWGVYGLIAANVVIWLTMVWRGASIGSTMPSMLLVWGGNLAVLVQDGQWWRLLTALFLHSSLKHLVANMAVLYLLGTHVERFFGTRSFLLVYFGAGLLGSALSLHFAAHSAVSVGASGAVFGVGGALLVAILKHRRDLPQGIHTRLVRDVVVMVGYSLLQGFLATHVDNAAHVGGLLGGSLLALCLPVRLGTAAYRGTPPLRMAMAATAAAVTVAAVATLAPAAPQAARDILAGTRQFEHAATQLMEAIRLAAADAEAVKSGRMSPRDADLRSRTVQAPAFEQVRSALARVTLPPGDARAPLLRDMTLLADRMHEYAQMESVWDAKTSKYVPVDDARGRQIDADIQRLLQQISSEAKSKRGH